MALDFSRLMEGVVAPRERVLAALDKLDQQHRKADALLEGSQASTDPAYQENRGQLRGMIEQLRQQLQEIPDTEIQVPVLIFVLADVPVEASWPRSSQSTPPKS